MAAEVVKHALSLINGDEIKIVAEKLGADPIKLRDVSGRACSRRETDVRY